MRRFHVTHRRASALASFGSDTRFALPSLSVRHAIGRPQVTDALGHHPPNLIHLSRRDLSQRAREHRPRRLFRVDGVLLVPHGAFQRRLDPAQEALARTVPFGSRATDPSLRVDDPAPALAVGRQTARTRRGAGNRARRATCLAAPDRRGGGCRSPSWMAMSRSHSLVFWTVVSRASTLFGVMRASPEVRAAAISYDLVALPVVPAVVTECCRERLGNARSAAAVPIGTRRRPPQ